MPDRAKELDGIFPGIEIREALYVRPGLFYVGVE